MSDRVDIANLIERLEKATGPDRKLDALIAIHVALWSYEKRKGDRNEYWRDPADISRHSSYQPRRELLRYTASIDAALGLVERCLTGWKLHSLQHHRGDDAWTAALRDDAARILVSRWATAQTAPLAILLALLHATLSLSETIGSDIVEHDSDRSK